MGRQRTWDFDEGLRLHAAGWSIPRIAVHLGVADANVRRVVDPAYNARCVEATRRSRKSAVCVDCGATIWKRSGSSSGLRCVPCAALAAATSVRADTLRCSACGEWKPDEAYPRRTRAGARRGRHQICRGCQAEVRRRHRHSRRVPCRQCGQPRCHPKDSSIPKGRPDTGLCLDCWRASPEFAEFRRKGIAASAAKRRKAAA